MKYNVITSLGEIPNKESSGVQRGIDMLSPQDSLLRDSEHGCSLSRSVFHEQLHFQAALYAPQP